VRSGSWRKQTHAITPDTEEGAEEKEEGAEEKEEGNEVGTKTSMQTSPTKTAMTWGGITMLLVGTLFFLVPDGLSAWAGSIVDFIRGWLTIFLVQPWFLVAALLMYGPLALIFVVRRLVRGQFKTDPTSKETGILAGVFLLLALIYPAHQAGDLAWMLVPLWALAALEFSDELVFISTRRWEIILASAIAFIFIVFIWLNLISIPSLFNNSTHVESSIILAVQNLLKSIGVVFNGVVISRILIMLGALVLLILSMLLVTTIWETKVTQLGIGWGGTIALLLYTVNAGICASGLRIPYSVEMWQPSPQFVQADLMLKTIDHLSDWRKGHIDSLEIFVETSANTPAVAWLLRDWKVTQVDAVSAADSPDLVILPEGYEGTLTSEYRGQDFVIKKTPIWYGLSMDDWLRWIAFREISERSENLVLWARNDLFPDPGASSNTSTP